MITNLCPPFSHVRCCSTIVLCCLSQCSCSGKQLVWEEVHELAQLSNMTNKDPPLIAKWFDCHGYTGTLVVRDLPEVRQKHALTVKKHAFATPPGCADILIIF